jgi:hypothetical protein
LNLRADDLSSPGQPVDSSLLDCPQVRPLSQYGKDHLARPRTACWSRHCLGLAAINVFITPLRFGASRAAHAKTAKPFVIKIFVARPGRFELSTSCFGETVSDLSLFKMFDYI